nr:hypothetical protein [Tanacetum cinerariifolium]
MFLITCIRRDFACRRGVRNYLILLFGLDQENPNHPNDPNVPEGEQAPTTPDGFAPQWIVERPSSPLPTPRLSVPPTVIENLSTVWVMGLQTGQIMSRLKEIETRVQQVESRVDTHPSGQMAVQGHDVIAGSSQQVQTLQTALHETELQNQQLRTRVTEMESHVGILMSYMMWREDRLTVLEKRLPGPPPGPQ